jgi:hypothetical protein
MSSPFPPKPSSATKDRASGGRFAGGNPDGPGNPFARRTSPCTPLCRFAELRTLELRLIVSNRSRSHNFYRSRHQSRTV